ncbi:MAG: TIGR02206 family membrane protein [Phycisphaerales bacterium]|nr:TIGR02206 family membrane protein [Planctomycetota bacterium]MCH8508287.1 TIGR02206 family membrane protein [Phycisphaerales bacterium]
MNWLETPFEPFTLTHLAIATLALVFCMACGVAARVERTRGRRSFADGFAGVVFGWMVLSNIWWMVPANWTIERSLPLHVCDFAVILVPLALWTRNRLLLSLVLLWGLGLSTQAFFTPTVEGVPGDFRFWLFWGGHLAIAAGCCVIAGGVDFRPGWKDWGRVFVIGVFAVLALMGLNHLLGTNYGYVGNQLPSTPTLIDRLGPWPLRVVWLILIGGVAQALVVVLFPVLRLAVGVLARPWLRR